jgi:ferredoxin-NADP reductase
MNATRLRDSAFKRVLQSVPLGTLMTLDAPYGSFLLHDDAAIPAVFLAGGIGITPVRSIVVEATLQRLPHRIYLFHANRGPEAVPFFDSLTALENRNPNFRYIPTMTRPDKSAEKWGGETGYINIPMLNRHLHDLSAPIYYVSGPQVMVLALKKMLLEGGINETNIRTEEFEGYDKAPEPVVTMEKAVA